MLQANNYQILLAMECEEKERSSKKCFPQIIIPSPKVMCYTNKSLEVYPHTVSGHFLYLLVSLIKS